MAIILQSKRQDVPQKRISGYMSGTYTVETVTNALLTSTNAEANGFSIYDSLGAATVLNRTVTLAGDGTVVIRPGFVPKYVRVTSITSRIQKEWFEGMNVTDSLLTVAAGTRSLVTTSGLLISSSAAGGTAPVTTEPVPLVTIDASVDTLIADSDTWIWVIEG